MAVDPLIRSTADSALKEFYLPGIRSILNSEVFLLSQVETNSQDIEGRRAVLSINTLRNTGIGARAENTQLPDAGHQGYAEERVALKYNYGRIQLSGPVIRSMGSDQGSFTRAITSETQGVTRDLRNDVNRQLYGDGSGAIAAATAGASSLNVTLTTPTTAQKRQLGIGTRVDIGTLANPTATATARTIAAVNTAGGVITLDAAGGAIVVPASSFVFRTGSGGTAGAASQKEITGLAAQVANTGVLWNIDPALVPDWASYVDANGGTPRAVAEPMFLKAAQEVNVRCGAELNLWVTSCWCAAGVRQHACPGHTVGSTSRLSCVVATRAWTCPTSTRATRGRTRRRCTGTRTARTPPPTG